MLNQKAHIYNQSHIFSLNNSILNDKENSISSEDSLHSKENQINSDSFSINKNKKLIHQTFSTNDSFSFNLNQVNKNNKNGNEEIKAVQIKEKIESKFNRAQNVLKELNSQLTKMNYCNIIQTNSIQRLDLSLSFLSRQINTLQLLNKKRKSKIQKNLDKFKKDE